MQDILTREPTTLTDDELVIAVSTAARAAAIMEVHSRREHPYDDICTKLYAEATRRGKPELYEKGYYTP